MATILEWFEQGGIFMWYIVYADVVAITLTIVLLLMCTRNRYKTFMTTLVLAGLLPFLFGLAGHWMGYRTAMQALMYVELSQKHEMYRTAMSMARIPSSFGALSSVLILLVGVVGLRLRRQS